MMRYTMSQLLRLSVVAGSVALGGTVAANAAYLTGDGDFGLQSNGVVLTAPWFVNEATGSTVTDSPFTNAFAVNGKSVHEGTGMPYFGQTFTSVPSTATGYLYLNQDFKFSGTGGFNWILSDGTYSTGRTLGLYFSDIVDIGVRAESASGMGDVLLVPEIGKWYNVQLTLDLNTDTYSGVITTEGTLAQTLISSRSFVMNKDISILYSDSGMPSLMNPLGMDHYVDNFVLSTTPMPIPEPGVLALLACGAFGVLAARGKRADRP